MLSVGMSSPDSFFGCHNSPANGRYVGMLYSDCDKNRILSMAFAAVASPIAGGKHELNVVRYSEERSYTGQSGKQLELTSRSGTLSCGRAIRKPALREEPIRYVLNQGYYA